ncbi:MAG: efflux RND transporter periplasmic adaptor subunit [Chromatiales bacterium]
MTTHKHNTSSRTFLAASLWLFLVLSQSAMSAGEPVPVTAVRLDSVQQKQQFDAPAEVVALNTPDLSSQLTAVVESIPVRVGDRVAAGDRLVNLNCELYESRLKTAEAELQRAISQRQFAAAQLKRAKNLSSSKSISEELLNQRSTELSAAEADYLVRSEQLTQARLDVSYCQVDAPFAAAVTARLQHEGALAVPGSKLLSLVQLDNVEVKANLRLNEMDELRAASSIAFVSDGETYPLQLRSMVPVLDERSRTREARLLFAAAQALPGTPGRLAWQSSKITLPANFLVRREGRLGVFLLDDEQAQFHELPGALEGQPAVINLSADSLLIVEGRQRLNHGDAVRLTPQQPSPDAP